MRFKVYLSHSLPSRGTVLVCVVFVLHSFLSYFIGVDCHREVFILLQTNVLK